MKEDLMIKSQKIDLSKVTFKKKKSVNVSNSYLTLWADFDSTLTEQDLIIIKK
jgi:hypothetical protein